MNAHNKPQTVQEAYTVLYAGLRTRLWRTAQLVGLQAAASFTVLQAVENETLVLSALATVVGTTINGVYHIFSTTHPQAVEPMAQRDEEIRRVIHRSQTSIDDRL